MASMSVSDRAVSKEPGGLDVNALPHGIPPAGSLDAKGSTETFKGTQITHWYLEASGVTWHAAVAGDPANDLVIMLHGYPESWFAFCHQVSDLSSDFFVMALDLPGYGQSDKNLEIDFDYANIARLLGDLVIAMGAPRFHLIAHDRGAVIADHLCAVESINPLIRKYVRMQQSGCKPHSEPRPDHNMFRSEAAVEMFRNPEVIVDLAYGLGKSHLISKQIDADVLKRLVRELSYPGVAEGAAASFKSASFDGELEDRMTRLFKHMTMPVLFLQGALDPGQQPHEYEEVTRHVAKGALQFIDANHFLHLEEPAAVSAAISAFLKHYPGER